MRGWLLDTNVIAELASARPDPNVACWASAADESTLYLSVLTLGEYDQGIANLPQDHPQRPRLEAGVKALELRFAGRILSVGDAVVRRWGRLAGEGRRREGRAPPVVDTMLAATAIEHDLTLVTRNVKDVVGSGALVLNPWA